MKGTMHKRPSRVASLAALPAVMLVLAPIAVTVWQAAHVQQGWVSVFLRSPASLPLLLNTVGLTVSATLAAAVLGTVAAFLVVRTNVPLRGLWLALGAAPLAVPAFVASYAWVSISPWFEGFGGALLVVSLAYYPLVFLPVMAALRNLDPSYEEAARVLGRSGRQALFKAVLPQLVPAIMGGASLVALNVLVEYGAFAMMRFHTFTTQIFLAFTTGMDQGATSALSMVLLALCLLVLALNGVFDRPRRYARVAKGAARIQQKIDLGLWRWPAALFQATLAGASVGVPLATIVYWLGRHGASAISPAIGSLPNVMQASLTSIGFGLGAAILTCVLAFPLALLAARHERLRWVRVLNRGAWMAQGLPGIVVALSFIVVAIRLLPWLYQSTALLLVAYSILFMSFALVSLRAALVQAPASLEEAARMLGRGRLAVLWRITLPLALPGIGAAAALVFTAVVAELTATLLLVPLGDNTLATRVWQDISTLAFASAAPFAAVLILLSAVGSWLAVRRFGETAAVRGD
jgi:iron(III) transport system permease protein